MSYVLGGWSINGIWSAYSGGRFTVYESANVSNSSGGGTQRPNRIGKARCLQASETSTVGSM